MPVLSCCHKQFTCAIAFYIIIYVVCRLDEELYASILPDVFVVCLSNSSNALFLYSIVKKQGITGMGSSELNSWLVRIVFRPVDVDY